MFMTVLRDWGSNGPACFVLAVSYAIVGGNNNGGLPAFAIDRYSGQLSIASAQGECRIKNINCLHSSGCACLHYGLVLVQITR